MKNQVGKMGRFSKNPNRNKEVTRLDNPQDCSGGARTATKEDTSDSTLLEDLKLKVSKVLLDNAREKTNSQKFIEAIDESKLKGHQF